MLYYVMSEKKTRSHERAKISNNYYEYMRVGRYIIFGVKRIVYIIILYEFDIEYYNIKEIYESNL